MNQNNTTQASPVKSLTAILKDATALLPPLTEVAITDTGNTGRKATEARYMIFELMEKAGYSQQQIAHYFKIDRTSVCKALAKLDIWKSTYADINATCVRLEIFTRQVI